MRRLVSAAAAIGLIGLAIATPRFGSAQTTTPQWAQFHNDPGRDGIAAVTGAQKLQALQIFSILAGTPHSTLNSSVVVDAAGTAYVGGEGGSLYALTPTNAAVKWSQALAGPEVGTPALSPDGSKVFAASYDGTMYAFAAASGNQIWKVSLGSNVVASPLVSNDGSTVFIPTLNGTLYALSTTDGSQKWKFSPGGAMPTSAAAGSGGGTIYIVVASYLYAIPSSGPANGTQGQTMYLDGAGTSTPAVDQNGNVYVGTENGYIDCFTPTGQMCWGQQHQVQGYPSITSTPSFIGGNAIFGGGNYVYAISQSSGSQVWQFATKGGVNSSPAIASTNSTIYVGSDDSNLYALNTTGQQVAVRALNGQVDASPAIGTDGSIWISDRTGDVYHLGVIQPPATLPIPSGTPTFPATSTPSATTTPVATSTPTLTPTSTAIPLTVSVSGKVKSGQKETITVKSTPNTVVHIRVQYPNGDHQSHQVTTNASGSATYTYTQGASKVTHKAFVATVTAKVGSGATANTQTATYSIAFGKIDLSIEPRAQAVGKVIDIFVHAAKGSRVEVFILPPNGHVIKKTGHTGPKGFASIKVKIPKGLVSGHNKKVTVQAKLVNNPNVSTKSNFTVK